MPNQEIRKDGFGKRTDLPRRPLAVAIAGSLMLASPAADARAPLREQPLPPRTAAQAPGNTPQIGDMFEGLTIEFGCPAEGMSETFRSAQVALRENGCGMELSYILPDGSEKKIHLDSTAREERGAVRDVMVGERHSVILTENHILVVPGRGSGLEEATSTDIPLPDSAREHTFDSERCLFYFLTPEKRIYVIDVSDPDGDWERSPANPRIGEDAKLVVFRGVLLALQSGEVPVIAFQDARPGSEGWLSVAYPLDRSLAGPASIEVGGNGITLRCGGTSLEITVETEGDARSVAISRQ